MGKTNNKLANLYLFGMALVVIGFILPMFKGTFKSFNGFDFINFRNFKFCTIGSLLVFIGSVLGIILSFVKSVPKHAKLVALIISILGLVILLIGFNDNTLTKIIGKKILKNAYIGFYCIIIGWITSILGFIKSN